MQFISQLAVSPQPRVNGEWITVTSGSQLAVKVEGVIQHGSKPGLFRSVEKVIVTLNTQPTAKANANEKVCSTTKFIRRYNVFSIYYLGILWYADVHCRTQ